MRLTRKLLIACLVASSCVSFGQEAPGQFGLSIGYYYGNVFQNRLGQDNRLQGIQVEGDLTLAKLKENSGDFRMVSSVMFGNRSGNNSVSGNIYRIGAKFTARQPGQNFYFLAGAGYAWTQELGRSNFSEHNGIAGQLGIGYQFAAPPNGRARSFFEISYYMGHEQTSGLSLIFGVRM